MSRLDEYFAKANRGSQTTSSVSASGEKPASNMDAYFAKAGKPVRANPLNLYTEALKASQGQSTMQTPYADAAAKAKQSGTQNLYAQAAENAKKSGTNNSFLHGIAGIFEKAAAGAKEGLRTGLNEISYRAQAAAPLNAADDAYYKAMWEQTTGQKTGVEIPTDTRTQQQKDLDEYMGVAELKNDSARAMQRAAEKEYERLDKEGVKTAFQRDNTYQEKVDQKYADLGPKWQRAMNIAGSVGNQALPIIGRIAGTALLGEKGGEAFQSLLFFNQASGAAIEEALEDGASWDKALTYGTVIGSIEAATEAAGDMANKVTIKAAGKYLPKEQFTKALIGTLTGNKTMRTALTILGQMHGEGLEEVASDLVSPFAKSIYNGKTIGENWMNDVTLQGLWESYLAGAISGGFLSGIGGAVNGQFRAQNESYANETVNAKIEEARASMKENGLFNSETREKIIDAGAELGALETQQQTAAKEAREHMQMIREMQRALRGDEGAQERISRMQEGTYTAGAQNVPVGAQRAQNEGNSTTPAAAINIQEGMNNGQSTYHREESGAAYVGSRGQAAEGAEGGLQALTGGRTEVQRGVGADAQADLRQVTPAQLGIRDGGTEAVTVVDAQRLGGEAKSAYDAVLENGLEPVAVRGAIQVNNGYANAYTESGRVFFRVDAVDSRGNAISPEALVRHEMFHNYASEEVIRATDEKIRENMTNEEYVAMREAYKADYAMVYDFANMSVDEIERLLTEEIAADAYAGLNWFSGDATVQEAVRAETGRNAPARRAEAQQETTGPPEGRAQAFVGYDAETGRGIYRSNFEDNTPKAKKSERVIRLIQDVWSKNPIDLVVENEDGSKSVIKAEFDPRFDEGENTRSDAAKLAAGNRHGTAGEKRVTLNLADDFYRIIQESTYSGSKAETGKKSDTHAGVNMWRYFVNPILYMERSGDETTPYTVSIDVKQKDNGNFVYSFHAERDAKNNGQPAPQTLHAAVNGAENDTANGLPMDSIRSTSGNSQEKSSGRASVAGIQARTADRAALRRAEALEKSGTDNETIRQETGWYRGMDGQWRFEIDDSGAAFSRSGEAQYSADNADYARYTQLMNRMLTGELTEAEHAELLGLDKKNGSTKKELARRIDEGNATLRDIMQHNALFEAYPEIAETKVKFADMPSGTAGRYNRETNTITLDTKLKYDANEALDALMHEVQHRVQAAEGFTSGTNPGYWNRAETYEKAAEKYRDNRARLLNGLSAEDRALYNEYRSIDREMGAMFDGSVLYDESRMDALEKRSDELYKELYGKEWFGKLNRYDRILGDAGEAVKEFYRNTAGEIEARDTTYRRRMSAEERKNTPPKLGDADTVFADGANVSMEIDADSDTEILHLKDQLRAAEGRLKEMRPVASVQSTGAFMARLSDRRAMALQKLNANKKVDRQNFGEIRLDDASIRKGIKYVRDAADLAAFEAVPAVLKRGIQINHHEQHKGGKVSSTQNVESWTFAAPITMNGRLGHLAVVVQKTKDMAYKAHKMLTPDGKAFVLDGTGITTEAESRPDVNAAQTGGRNATTDSASMATIRQTEGNSQEKSSGRASVEVSGINNRTAAELRREYERRMQEYQKATQRDDQSYPYIAEMKWIQAAERRLAELGDGKHRRRTVGSTKRDIMQLFSTDRANRTDVERVLNRNIGEMMAQGEIRGDALDTLVNELLQTGSVVSSSKNSPWIDKTYESIRSDLKGGKLYVSKDMWRDFSKDEARELRERAKSAGITLSDNRRYTPPDVRNMELAEKYGEALFPTDISAPDMLRNIIYCAEQGANEKQTLADRLWDEARKEGLGAAREEAYSRMVNDLRDKTEVILREFAEDNHLKLKEQTKAEAKSVSYFDTKKAPVKEYSRRKGDYRPINNLGEYTREIVEMESALETKDAYIIEQGENRFRVKIEEDSGRFYAAVYRNGEMVASSSAASRGRLPHWAATEIRKNIGEQISFSPALENRGESYNADLKAAEEAGYPVFEKKNGEKVQTVPFWTWVRNKERGNYGIVIAQTNKTDSNGNRIVEVYYYNKQKDTGKVVGESAETVYAVDGKYSDPNEVEKSAARMKDEESEAMRAEEREALWRETQKGSPFEAQPNATTDTRERVTKATSAGVQRLFQQLISKGKTEVSTQVESGIRTYTAKMNTNGVEYWVDISDGRQDVQRFREFEKEKAAQLAAEWMDKEANRAYTAANEKRAEARRAELSAEENAKIAELFGNTEELKTAETPEDAPSPGETAESRVTDEIVKAEKSFRESLADVTHGAMRMFVNAGETVRRISKQTKNKSLEGYYFNAGAYSQRAGNWIAKGGARTDISGHKTGESLMDILGDIMKTPEKYKDFQLMLLHRNNVDRMRYDNKEEVQNLTKCVTTIEDLYPKLRGLDNDYLFQTAVPGDKRDMLSREWKETVLDELLSGEMPEIADISEAAQMLIFTRQKISEAKKNGLKPVFGYEVTAYDSQLEAERLLKANPEFDALAKRVYAYFDDLLQYRIDAGLDTQKHVDAMKKRYPNYVPTMRVEGTEGKTARRARRNGGIVVSNAIGRAVGGDAVIMPLHTAMSRKTVAVMKNAGLNQFGEQLVQSWNQDKSIPGVNKVEMVDYSSTDQYVDSEELYVPVTNNVFSVLRGNDRYNITMDEGLAQAMNAFQPDKYANSDVAKLLKKGNDLFKALCTGYNPIFMVRNLVRDAQDAAFYSTDSATWAKMFPSAWKQIVTNGEIWQQYKALGGSYASMLDYTTGMVKEPKNALGKAAARYESLGQAIEAAPRLAEFMTILANKGGSKTADGVKTGQFTQSDLMEAMLGAADITTNFARGGTVTKMLNKYLVPFLNPSVQGADKFVRNITDRKGFKAWASLAIKAAALGILPELLNGLLYRDDDEWDDIPDQTKSNYYLFKLGDGYWMKIPRGRALAVFSAGATYAQEKAKGNDPKFSDVIEVVKSNVAPTDIFNQNIATAWTQTKLFNPDNPGTTWYGGNIESDRLQNYRPGERYDEKTDELSKWIGKTFNLSPKKINYLLDQYSGVVGDLLLPWFTPSTTASSPALAPLKQAFMLDSTSTNKTTGEYYDLLDDLKYDANDGDIGAGITRKYVSHAGDEVNDYYQQIRAIQSDENLTKAEKNRLVRALKAQLIERQKEIIAQAEPYREAVSDYLKAHPELSTDNDAAIAEYAELYGITEDQAESRMDAIVYREANREVFGAEYALRTYNADVYDKARTAYAKGVSYETYYDYYFATKEMHADKDENGKSISGSKKAKVVEYINSLDIPPEQKDALYVAAGYTAKSARNQKWNGGSGGSGGRRGSGKKTTLKAPDAPKAAKITIHGAGAGGGTASAGTVSAPKASVKVADIAEAADLVKLREAAKKATRTAIKAGNRTIYIEDGSPLDYFLKTGKLPSTK